MKTPYVEVIAHTTFRRVPEALLPVKEYPAFRCARQDQGSDLARLIECAGRTCYDSYGKGRSSEAYHQHILDVGHGSVLEHASITFYIAGISRGCSHELVRHRAGTAISQRSTRYVEESESDWCWHPLIDVVIDAGELTATAGEGVERVQDEARDAYSALVRDIEGYLVSRDVDPQTARKQARGAARGVLGNALETAMVWTANIRALRNVLEQRASPFADAEIRLLANRLYEAALEVCPEYFSDYQRVECPDGIGYGLETLFRKV